MIKSGGVEGRSQKLYERRFRLDVRKYTFINRIVDIWNSRNVMLTVPVSV